MTEVSATRRRARPYSSTVVVTAATIVLAIAGVVIGYLRWQIAARQEQVSVAKFSIDKVGAQPQFRLRLTSNEGWMATSILSGPHTATITIANQGSPVTDVHCYPHFFFVLECMVGNELGHFLLAPIRDVTTRYVYRSMSGPVAEMQARTPTYSTLREAFDLWSRGGDFPASYQPFRLFLLPVIDIRYTDTLGETHRSVYIVGANQTRSLPEPYAGRLVNDHQQKSNAISPRPDTGARPQTPAEVLYRDLVNAHTRFASSEDLWRQVQSGLDEGRTVEQGHLDWDAFMLLIGYVSDVTSFAR